MARTKLFNEEEVLKKAALLFWKQGYHATSIQDLVSHLGINRASLYDTYGGKSELFERAIQHYRSVNTVALTQFFASQTSVKEGLRTLLETTVAESINDCDSKGCFVVNTAVELIPGDEKIHAILHENKKKFEAMIYEFLLKGQQSGEITTTKNLQALAGFYFTFYNGLKVVSKVEPNEDCMLASVDFALGLLE